MPRLENKNPNEIEKKLFADYGIYLLNIPGAEHNPNVRKYVPILDMSRVQQDYKDTGIWPEYLMPHDINIVYSGAIVFDMMAQEIKINGYTDAKCLKLIYELLSEWNWT